MVDNWLWHSHCFKLEEFPGVRPLSLFNNLVLDKSLIFQFCPWESIRVRKDLPYLGTMAWAISTAHIPLLEAIFTKDQSERYLAFASQRCWQEDLLADPQIPQNLLRKWRTWPQDVSRNVRDGGTRLYCQLLLAVRVGNFKVIQVCFWNTRQLPETHSWVKGSHRTLFLKPRFIANKGLLSSSVRQEASQRG